MFIGVTRPTARRTRHRNRSTRKHSREGETEIRDRLRPSHAGLDIGKVSVLSGQELRELRINSVGAARLQLGMEVLTTGVKPVSFELLVEEGKPVLALCGRQSMGKLDRLKLKIRACSERQTLGRRQVKVEGKEKTLAILTDKSKARIDDINFGRLWNVERSTTLQKANGERLPMTIPPTIKTMW